jgi:hypothetical protein
MGFGTRQSADSNKQWHALTCSTSFNRLVILLPFVGNPFIVMRGAGHVQNEPKADDEFLEELGCLEEKDAQFKQFKYRCSVLTVYCTRQSRDLSCSVPTSVFHTKCHLVILEAQSIDTVIVDIFCRRNAVWPRRAARPHGTQFAVWRGFHSYCEVRALMLVPKRGCQMGVFVVLFSFSSHMPRYYLQIGHDLFLPKPSEFSVIIDLAGSCEICKIETISLYKLRRCSLLSLLAVWTNFS